ncbi:MAG: SCO family protein [Dongiaceae bacterium]
MALPLPRRLRPLWLLIPILLLAYAPLWLSQQNPAPAPSLLIPYEFKPAFTLTDHNGVARSLQDFEGKLAIVYFGFTQCPDICPVDLLLLSQALQKLQPVELQKIQPLFITIDPKNDNPQIIKTYLSSFHPSLLGLTGKPAQITQIAKNYGVFVKEEAHGEHGGEISHSAMFYVIDPVGKPLGAIRRSIDPEALARTIAAAL